MKQLELTPDEWRRADALARDLAKNVDRNEFGKVVAYLRRAKDTDKVLTLLRRLPNSAFIRSNQTRGYLERIAQAWDRHLKTVEGDRALLVANWAFRLMTYYQTNPSAKF